MAHNKSLWRRLWIFVGLGVVSIGGIFLGATKLQPTIEALEPMLEAASRDSVDDYETRYIPSESMLPTFQVNDRVLIHKKAYENNLPQRTDVIIFHPTEKLKEQNFNTPFINRIIGLPGETVEVKEGKVYWGYVPQELIIGKVVRIFWPPKRVREFD